MPLNRLRPVQTLITAVQCGENHPRPHLAPLATSLETNPLLFRYVSRTHDWVRQSIPTRLCGTVPPTHEG